MKRLDIKTEKKMKAKAQGLGINFLLADWSEANANEADVRVGEFYLVVQTPIRRTPIINEMNGIAGIKKDVFMFLGIKADNGLKTGGINGVDFGRYEKNIAEALRLFDAWYNEFIKDCKAKISDVEINDTFNFWDTRMDGILISLTITE